MLENLDSSTASITLHAADNKTAILNKESFDKLETAIEAVESNSDIKTLIFLGPSIKNFCAGADIQAIKGVTEKTKAKELAKRGQELINRISKLKQNTVAAISGACVGGGCELALACDYRIATGLKETKIGLPEVKLGILPGFGGCVRLPRLIGLPAALQIILQGKVISVKKAKRVGLVDRIISENITSNNYKEALVEASKLIVSNYSRKKIALKDKILTFTQLGRNFVKAQAKKNILKETKGKYPAPLAALDVCIKALSLNIEQGLELEAEEISKLIIGSESKSLVHLFLQSEKSKKLGKSVGKEIDEILVGVLGGGVMGAGIASVFLEKGFDVVLCDVSEKARANANEHINSYLDKRRYITESKKKEILSRLNIVENISEFNQCDLIVEAIIENLEIKQKVFKELSDTVAKESILASNTSSLSIDEIAKDVENPSRVIGMHFFNPAEKMPLVEIVRGSISSDSAVVKLAAIVAKINKFPVVVENVPGFLVNRVLSPYMAEASQLLSEGYSVEDIDRAATNFGMPMGPVRLLDEVGLDVAKKVQSEMFKAYGKRMKAPYYLAKMIEDKRLGKKSSLGFYKYEGKKSEVDNSIYNLLGLGSERKVADLSELSERLMLPMINEAVMCLDESVAGKPGLEAAGQVDLATVMGTGFAPFRGGAIKYSETLGASNLLAKFKKHKGDRFEPCDGIKSRAEKSISFYS